MADNVTITAGSGTTLASDDIGGVQYPRAKVTWGPDGTANDTDVASGKPMPVQLRGSDGTDRSNLLPVSVSSIAAGTNNIGDVDVLTVPTDPFGANADAASASGSISAKLRGMATALGTTALDLGAGTGGSRTLRVAMDTSQVAALGQTTKSASQPVTLASDDDAKVSLGLIDDAIVADDAAFTPATTKVMMAGFEADEASTDSVDEGDGGAARMTLDRKQIMTLQPHTNGGLSIFRSLDLDETEEDVKTSAGCLYKLRITNRTTSARYVKLYNATAANVTVGTTTPVDTIVVPGGGSADLATVITENFGGVGLTFDTALSMAATTGLADNDTGAPGANDVVVSAYYK